MAESRTQQAHREVGQTSVTPALAVGVAVAFVAVVCVVGLVQSTVEVVGAAGDGHASSWPQVLTGAMSIVDSAVDTAVRFEGGPARRVLAANRAGLRQIGSFEDELEDRSLFGRWLRPPANAVLIGALRAGNEKVYCGRGGWVFYRPAIDHLVGPGFLDPQEQARRASAAAEWQLPPQPDPRLAITQFQSQLAARGIELVVMPVPVKATVRPDRLSSRFEKGSAPPTNPSWGRFLHELTAKGVRVFDPTPVLHERATRGDEVFLAGDSHWRPESVAVVAERLAEYLQASVELSRPGHGDPTALEPLEVSNVGDLVHMLELPSRLAGAERVVVQQVTTASDTLWQADPSAEVLLLGDSFANIYSVAGMGWGESAGLAELLSHDLDRPVDVITRNDDGAHATRLMLSQEMARGRDRLAGKRVVVWEFSARELSTGDWRLLSMDLGRVRESHFLELANGETLEVAGTVRAMAPVPRPRSAPYPDYLVAVHIDDLDLAGGAIQANQALVFLWAMRDYELLPGAYLRLGERVRLRLRPWQDVDDELSSVNRGELFEGDLVFQEPCWGELLDSPPQ